MAVKIRLRRMGGKNNPNYRIIVADSRSPRNGKFIEEIGRYVPQSEPKLVEFKKEIARDWISKGAQPTDTVARLFRDYGLYEDSSEEQDSMVEENIDTKEEEKDEVEASEAEEVEENKQEEVETEEAEEESEEVEEDNEEEVQVQEETEDQE